MIFTKNPSCLRRVFCYGIKQFSERKGMIPMVSLTWVVNAFPTPEWNFSFGLEYYIISETDTTGGDSMKKVLPELSENTCHYCSGKGYLELLLGGSEECYACHGTGKEDKK
jgi:hypothetical protein